METNNNDSDDASNSKNSEAPNQDDNSDSGIISSISEPSVDPPAGRPEANTDTKLNAESKIVGGNDDEDEDEYEAHSNASNDTTDDNIVGGSGEVSVEVGVGVGVGVDDVAFTSMSSPVQELEENEINNSFSIRGELYFNPSASRSTEEPLSQPKDNNNPQMWLFSSPMNSPEHAELQASFDALDMDMDTSASASNHIERNKDGNGHSHNPISSDDGDYDDPEISLHESSSESFIDPVHAHKHAHAHKHKPGQNSNSNSLTLDESEEYELETALSPAPAPRSSPPSRRPKESTKRGNTRTRTRKRSGNKNTKNNGSGSGSGNQRGRTTASSSRNQHPARSTKNELMRHLCRSELNVTSKNNEQKMSPALTRRLRDFSFAQQKRRETYGEKMPWGIIGLYDHLTGIRTDIEWAEDAAWRRENNEPYLSWADFEGAKSTGFNQPFFTYIVMFICTGCLILSIGINGWKLESVATNPMLGPSAQTLIEVGAKQTSLIVNESQWYRLFSPIVLHAGIIHFVLNMLALWFVGYAVEMNHGFLSVAILFTVPAIGGNIMSALFLPEYISVGASGGIFGLIGGCIADIVSNWNLLFSKVVNPTNDGQRFRNVKVLIWLLLDILLNILIGLTPFVDNFTHLGGMIYGFLCGLSKLERLSKAFFGVRKGFLSKLQSDLVRFFGFILSIVCIIVTLIVLIRSDGVKMTNCRGCRYVSCVPFPFWAEYEDKWWYCDDCDLVSAEVKPDANTQVYRNITLTCPDGEIAAVDLSGDNIKDKMYLQKQLPQYCRDNCNSLFVE